MDTDTLIRLVERYFAAVDRMDLAGTLDCFTAGATFTIATYDTVHRGRDEGIRTMFERLNTRYARMWHCGFDHVVHPPLRIASRFRVENTLADGSVCVKHNCNFFRLDVSGGQPRFDQVVVYMSGDNSLA